MQDGTYEYRMPQGAAPNATTIFVVCFCKIQCLFRSARVSTCYVLVLVSVSARVSVGYDVKKNV